MVLKMFQDSANIIVTLIPKKKTLCKVEGMSHAENYWVYHIQNIKLIVHERIKEIFISPTEIVVQS